VPNGLSSEGGALPRLGGDFAAIEGRPRGPLPPRCAAGHHQWHCCRYALFLYVSITTCRPCAMQFYAVFRMTKGLPRRKYRACQEWYRLSVLSDAGMRNTG
jgi:hypothetical protein